jgi:hypothetical protein
MREAGTQQHRFRSTLAVFSNGCPTASSWATQDQKSAFETGGICTSRLCTVERKRVRLQADRRRLWVGSEYQPVLNRPNLR